MVFEQLAQVTLSVVKDSFTLLAKDVLRQHVLHVSVYIGWHA